MNVAGEVRAERFWAKVSRGPHCWLWTGAKNVDGYGVFQDGTTTSNAHRVAWELFFGPIATGLQLDHLCRIRACVNPAHLEPVTPRENQIRGNTFSARNVAKTHCPAGHPYDMINSRGARRCKRCLAAADARHYAKKKGR